MPRAKPVSAASRSPTGVVRRSMCPIACTLDLIGDKWTLLVVRDLLSGKSLFKEFLASPEGIATNILAERLSRLTERGFVERYPLADGAGRDAYRLTEKGRAFRELLRSIKIWGLEHIPGTDARFRSTE